MAYICKQQVGDGWLWSGSAGRERGRCAIGLQPLPPGTRAAHQARAQCVVSLDGQARARGPQQVQVVQVKPAGG